MARKMENGEPKIDIRENNGKFYAYSSTSRMENGKKVTHTTYYGRYDPETKTIKPKVTRGKQRSRTEIEKSKKELTVVDYLQGIECREYGPVYLLDEIQHRANLGRDLYMSFGPDVSKSILSVAMALTLHGGAFSHVEDTLDRSMIRQLYGLKSEFNPDELTNFTHDLGLYNSNIDDFYSMRVSGCGNVISWDSTTKGTYSTKTGFADYVKNNKDNEDIPQVKKSFASDKNGIPVLFQIYPGSMSDMATLKDFVDMIKRYGGKDIIHVMDRGYGSGSNIHYMNEQNVRFVVPAKIEGKMVKKLLTDFSKNCTGYIFDNHAYDVWETEVSLVPSIRKNVDGSIAYDIVDYDENKESIKAFVCFDTKKHSDEIQSLRLLINHISDKLDKIDSPNPMDEFKAIAGKASKYFEAKPDGRKLSFRVKRNAVSFAENRSGTFIMFSTAGMTWDEMMSSYDARRLVEQNIDHDKSTWKRFGTGDSVTMIGREFIRFVSLILKCSLNDVLRKNGILSGSEDVLNSMGSISALGRMDEWTVKNVCKKHRAVFDAIKLECPTSVVTDKGICTQDELDQITD